ncbi:hypothetical protein QJS10_CPA16g00556 [Acorus calamus]|uniref:Uncharacterized protein n=1 Tax=Acorus calamus TaxID=4465 RepID=A0AAV9D3X8_ACOCL|nr:hypothetical protein QJS10_CPA16g00556 [Acorus calamus]
MIEWKSKAGHLTVQFSYKALKFSPNLRRGEFGDAELVLPACKQIRWSVALSMDVSDSDVFKGAAVLSDSCP